MVCEFLTFLLGAWGLFYNLPRRATYRGAQFPEMRSFPRCAVSRDAQLTRRSRCWMTLDRSTDSIDRSPDEFLEQLNKFGGVQRLRLTVRTGGM